MIRYRQLCECGAEFEVETTTFSREVVKADLIEWAVNHGKVCSITGVKP